MTNSVNRSLSHYYEGANGENDEKCEVSSEDSATMDEDAKMRQGGLPRPARLDITESYRPNTL